MTPVVPGADSVVGGQREEAQQQHRGSGGEHAALTAGHLQPDTVICDQYRWTNQSFYWFSSFYKHYVSNDANHIILKNPPLELKSSPVLNVMSFDPFHYFYSNYLGDLLI